MFVLCGCVLSFTTLIDSYIRISVRVQLLTAGTVRINRNRNRNRTMCGFPLQQLQLIFCPSLPDVIFPVLLAQTEDETVVRISAERQIM